MSDDFETVTIGIIDRKGYQKRTRQIASGEIKPKPDDPKIWFSSKKALENKLGFTIGETNIEHLVILTDETGEPYE